MNITLTLIFIVLAALTTSLVGYVYNLIRRRVFHTGAFFGFPLVKIDSEKFMESQPENGTKNSAVRLALKEKDGRYYAIYESTHRRSLRSLFGLFVKAGMNEGHLSGYVYMPVEPLLILASFAGFWGALSTGYPGQFLTATGITGTLFFTILVFCCYRNSAYKMSQDVGKYGDVFFHNIR